MSELRVCQRCNRHVRATDTHCPFCSTEVTVLPHRFAPTRVTRAMVFAAATLAGTAGCDKGAKPKSPPAVTPKDAAAQAIDAGQPEPPKTTEQPDAMPLPAPYGAPPARRRLV